MVGTYEVEKVITSTYRHKIWTGRTDKQLLKERIRGLGRKFVEVFVQLIF